MFRVLRAFGRVSQLREIVDAIGRSIVPAFQALVRARASSAHIRPRTSYPLPSRGGNRSRVQPGRRDQDPNPPENRAHARPFRAPRGPGPAQPPRPTGGGAAPVGPMPAPGAGFVPGWCSGRERGRRGGKGVAVPEGDVCAAAPPPGRAARLPQSHSRAGRPAALVRPQAHHETGRLARAEGASAAALMGRGALFAPPRPPWGLP